jgi:hypothetical protein
MRQILVAAGLVATASFPAMAFDAPECGEIESEIYTILDNEFGWEVTQSPTSTAELLAGGCSVTNLEVYVEDLDVRYTIGAARMVAPEAMDWVRGDVILPNRVSFEVMDVVIDEAFGIPDGLGWMAGLSFETITVSASWDEDTQALSLAPLEIDLGEGNSVSMAMEGQAQGWEPYVMRDEDFGITRLEFNFALNGFFEDVIAPPLAANGVDLSPEAMAFFAAMTQGLMAAAPEQLLTAEAQAQVSSFLQTLPAPQGDLTLTLTNDEPFLPATVFADLSDGVPFVDAVPERLNIDAEWVPAE